MKLVRTEVSVRTSINMTIKNLLNAKSLFLTWQSPKDRSERYAVGELASHNGSYAFSYLMQNSSFEEARMAGFKGFPAFPISDLEYTNDVLPLFRKRLPPKSRRDFKKFLKQYGLSEDFSGSDFQLLAHTGCKLPSDGFNLVPDLATVPLPFEYVMEAAGTRYHTTLSKLNNLEIGDEVELLPDFNNLYDKNALIIANKNTVLGYVNRILSAPIKELVEDQSRTVRCYIYRISGSPERPLVFLYLSSS